MEEPQEAETPEYWEHKKQYKRSKSHSFHFAHRYAAQIKEEMRDVDCRISPQRIFFSNKKLIIFLKIKKKR